MTVRIVIAGTGFPLLRTHLAEALPEASIRAADPAALRAEGAAAEVLIPTMYENCVNADAIASR